MIGINGALDVREPTTDGFREDILSGMSRPHKELPCKYFYDERGSQLFERICTLPEYYPTRTELAIVARHGREMAARLGPDCLLVEFGSGSSLKTRSLLDVLSSPAAYVPVDISREQLLDTARSLIRDYPGLEVRPVYADFTEPFEIPAINRPVRKRVVYFPGSTIGNFPPDKARQLLARAARLCGPNGGMLLGADLKKDPRLLHAAYNDRQGVTAAFNLNLLVRINRELGANLNLDQFWHHALYNPIEGRVEIYLVSRVDQRVTIADRQFFLAEGEPICTEYSYKYNAADLHQLAAASGFAVEQIWMDESRFFSVLYLAVRGKQA
ncbi:MAG TPA: L-histidine N(alpha)-methyltransferase [Candidatus Binataceae bacterium]|nr:L-histidine N(alpha)-methyltransferase [Candidatus Binataceae bacterium]